MKIRKINFSNTIKTFRRNSVARLIIFAFVSNVKFLESNSKTFTSCSFFISFKISNLRSMYSLQRKRQCSVVSGLKPQLHIVLMVSLKLCRFLCSFKDTHRENTPSNKTKALKKSVIMCIWEIGTLNRVVISGSYNEFKFSKKLCSQWQIYFLCDRSILYSPFYLY